MFTYKLFLSFAMVMVLAGRALAAFNLTVGTQTLFTADILNIPDSPVKTACQSDCDTAKAALSGCNDDANCLCRDDTMAALTKCEECMFTELINTNKPMPDFRAGSTPVLAAYRSECNATTGNMPPADALTLSVPPTWDGPFVSILPTPLVVVYVFFGGFFGISALLLLCNM